LKGKNLGPENCDPFCSALAGNNSVLVLDLSDNQLGVDGNDAQFCVSFAKALKTNMTLVSVNLAGNFLRDAGAQALAQALSTNRSIQAVCISSNAIGVAGGVALGEALTANTAIVQLDLSKNNLCCDGAYAIAQAVDINSSLQALDLSDNSICYKAATDGAAETENCTDAVDLLADALIRHNQFLQVLRLRNNDMGEDAGMAIAGVLRFPQSGLREIDLSQNPLGDDSACSIAKSLATSPLRALLLSGIEAEDTAGECFAEVLKLNSTLLALDLSGNAFGEDTGHRVSQVLNTLNKTLQVLDLSDNNLKAAGLQHFEGYAGICELVLNNNR